MIALHDAAQIDPLMMSPSQTPKPPYHKHNTQINTPSSFADRGEKNTRSGTTEYAASSARACSSGNQEGMLPMNTCGRCNGRPDNGCLDDELMEATCARRFGAQRAGRRVSGAKRLGQMARHISHNNTYG